MTRTEIQWAISLPVAEALAELDLPEDLPHLRRICRACATLGIQRLLDADMSASYVAGQLLEALAHELEHRWVVAASHSATIESPDPEEP